MVSTEGLVPVRNITKTFKSGKTEKIVYQALADVGLPSEKSDLIDIDSFTFEKFYKIYQTICPRNDIDELFRTINGGQKDYIECAKLVDFLNDKQRDPRLNEILYPHYNEARVLEIVTRYETDPELINKKAIGKEAFTRYLMSDENSPVFLDRYGIQFVLESVLACFSGWISTKIWISPCPITTSTPRTTRISAADSSVENPVWRCTGRFCWPAAAVWSWTAGTGRGRTRSPSSRTARPCALTSSSKMSFTPSEIVLS